MLARYGMRFATSHTVLPLNAASNMQAYILVRYQGVCCANEQNMRELCRMALSKVSPSHKVLLLEQQLRTQPLTVSSPLAQEGMRPCCISVLTIPTS